MSADADSVFRTEIQRRPGWQKALPWVVAVVVVGAAIAAGIIWSNTGKSTATPLTNQPLVLSRTLMTLPALNTNASLNGWMDDLVNETRGNNVDAHTDRNGDNSPDLPRPQGSPSRTGCP